MSLLDDAADSSPKARAVEIGGIANAVVRVNGRIVEPPDRLDQVRSEPDQKHPVTPSTIVSSAPPARRAITGRPAA